VPLVVETFRLVKNVVFELLLLFKLVDDPTEEQNDFYSYGYGYRSRY